MLVHSKLPRRHRSTCARDAEGREESEEEEEEGGHICALLAVTNCSPLLIVTAGGREATSTAERSLATRVGVYRLGVRFVIEADFV